MITIEVFGPGCQRCQATKKIVHQAVRMLGVQANVVEVSDPKEMAAARVMFTPTVRVNGEVKCTGRVPNVAELTTWLATTAARAESA
jgi:small redox-active disulfide protein 2